MRNIQFFRRRSEKTKRFLLQKSVRRTISIVICVGLGTAFLNSFESFAAYRPLFNFIAIVSAIFFTVEYALRIQAAQAVYPHLTIAKARKKYIFSFYGIIDFISILPFIFSNVSNEQEWATMCDISRMFLILKFVRYSKAVGIFRETLNNVKEEMGVAIVGCIVIISFSATLMYYIEKQAQPEVFDNIGEGFWWAIITFTTVGYGDIYPITPLGKVLGGLIALIGMATIALPTALFTSSFMSRMKDEKDRKNSICPHCGKKIHK